MRAIFRRELHSYFSSPLGYCYLAAIFCFSGLYFFTTSLMGDSADLSAVFSGLFTVTLFLLPLVTMRLMSEEKKSGTDQLLLSSPVSGWEIVTGKYLSALILYTIGLSCTLLFAVVLSVFHAPSWPAVIGSFLGLWLVGAAIIAIGLYLSARTENQLIAGASLLAVSLLIIMTDALALLFPSGILRQAVQYCSFSSRIYMMTLGLFRLGDLFFFGSIAFFFLWISAARLSRRRSLS